MSGLVNIDVGSVAKSVMEGMGELFTSDKERAEGELAIMQALSKPHILQAMTNIEEAKHKSVFVAGWRPSLGWLCVVLLAYAWVGRDIITIILSLSGQVETIKILPEVSSGELMTLVLSLLGLGATRTFEKLKGVARHR